MKRLVLALFVLTAVGAGSLVHAQEVFCKITGSKQGVIKGDNTIKGLEDTIPVLALSEGVSSPIDQTTGQVTGRRVHKPFVIVKTLDSASPKLFMAAVTNENLTSVECSFYRRSRVGTMQLYFKIKLENALISSQDIGGDNLGGNVIRQNPGVQETVQFVFQKITLQDTVSGTVATDDWEVIQ